MFANKLVSTAFRATRAAVVRAPIARQQPVFSVNLLARRNFASAVFLERDEVTQRCVNVVRNFQKVDPAKV